MYQNLPQQAMRYDRYRLRPGQWALLTLTGLGICAAIAYTFYRSLAAEAGLAEETEEELNRLIENKNYFGAEELLRSLDIREALRQAFRQDGRFSLSRFAGELRARRDFVRTASYSHPNL